LSNKIVNFPRRVASEMPRSRHLDPINPQTPRPSGPAIAGHSTSATRNELPAKDALEENTLLNICWFLSCYKYL